MASVTKRWRVGRWEWRVRWQDKRSKQREKTFLKASAAARFAGTLEEHKDSSPKDRGTKTFSELADEYIEASEKGRDGKMPLEYSTLLSYKGYLKNHILPEIGALRVTELDRTDMAGLLEVLTDNLKSRRSASLAFTLTKSILKWAVTREIIKRVPAEGLAVRGNKRGKKKQIEVHTKDEMHLLLAKAKALSEDRNQQIRVRWQTFYPLILLLVSTGLRISECLALKRSDFSPDMSTVSIGRRVDRMRAGRSGEGRLGDLKTEHAHRTIPVPVAVRELLRRSLALHSHEWVFPSKTGGLRDPGNLDNRVWRPLQRKAGVRVFGIHALRHYFASLLMERGLYKEAQSYLGHHSAAFTMDQYGHLIDDGGNRQQRIAEDVMAALGA